MWFNGGDTVVSGPVAGIALAWLTLTLLLIIRTEATGGNVQTVPAIGIKGERALLAVEAIGVVAIFAAWNLTGAYFLGWVATYSAILLLVASSLRLMVEVLVGRERPEPKRRRRGNVLLSLPTLHFLSGAVGIGLIVFTSGIHGWSSGIIYPITFIVLSALGLSVAGRTALVALRARSRLSQRI